MNALRRRGDRAIARRLVQTELLAQMRRERLVLLRESINLRINLLRYPTRNLTERREMIASIITLVYRREGTLDRSVESLGHAIDRELTRSSPNLFCA